MAQSRRDIPRHPYALTQSEVLEALGVDPGTGLDAREAARRLEEWGPNELPEGATTPAWLRFLRQFHNLLIYVLLASALLTAVLGEWVDSGVICAVVVVNAVVGYVQEERSEKALAGIRNLLSSEASVKRDGVWLTLPARDVVPGDIVRLQAGERVPADIRLVREEEAAAEESALTGESEPAQKDVAPVPEDAGIGDRSSMMFSSTMLTSGTATGVVVATGTHTEIGDINDMMTGVDRLDTPLSRQMGRFTAWLSVGTLAVAALLVWVGVAVHGQELGPTVMAGVGFIVAAIPEGLPALITITLALGVQTMARHNAITRSLSAVHAIGSVSVICSDKTGTLTRNEMTVVKGIAGACAFKVTGSGYAPKGEVRPAKGAGWSDGALPESIAQLAYAVGLVNETDLVQGESGWGIAGEPTEGALVAFCRKAGVTVDREARGAILPFSSDHKFMAATVQRAGEGVLYVKGAPDVLLARSRWEVGSDGRARPVDADLWRRRIEELSGEGLRVLAAARREATPEDARGVSVDSVGRELMFLGIVGIEDPPREEAIRAIEAAHGAGIRVIMITGDHAGTAGAIAERMGIRKGTHGPVVTGAQIEKASDTELQEIARGSAVFARTSPEHKLRLVRALQAQSHVVAMTGDGVNDSPALRRADVGVAMGIKGTEVTKDAADVVLADDNFATIEHAIEEGRRIRDNLRKAIVFLLVTNGSQSLVTLLAILGGLTLALTPLQILWVNMVTAVTLAFAFAFEPAEAGIMERPPEGAKEPIVRPRHVLLIALASAIITAATMGMFSWALQQGYSIEEARTAATLTLVAGQAFYLFNVKALESSSLRLEVFTNNRVAWLVVGILAALQTLYTYAPPMHSIFASAPLGLGLVALSLALGASVFLAIELAKPLLQRRSRVASPG